MIIDSEYITNTGNIPNSCIKFQYVGLQLTPVSSYFSSNIVMLIECSITCNNLYVSSIDNSVITCLRNTITGNVLLASGSFQNLQVSFTNNIIYGSLTAFTNLNYTSAGAIKATSQDIQYPMLYNISNNTIGIMGFNSYNTTGISLICGMTLSNNAIGTLFSSSNIPIAIGFSNIINNTVTNTNLADTTYTTYCSLLYVAISLNTFQSAVRFGDIAYSTINDNSFLDLVIGSEVFTGSLTQSKFVDNTLSNLTINAGTNINTLLQDNEVDPLAGVIVVNGDMDSCIIKSNRSSSTITFNGAMIDNLVNINDVSGIIYNGTVDGDKIEHHRGTTITFNKDIQNTEILSNNKCPIVCNGTVTSSTFADNVSCPMIFNAKVRTTSFNNNVTVPNVNTLIAFYAKAYALTVISNTFVKFAFNKVLSKSIVALNIFNSRCDLYLKKCTKHSKITKNLFKSC